MRYAPTPVRLIHGYNVPDVGEHETTAPNNPSSAVHLRSREGRMPLRPYTCNVFIIEGENSIRKFALEVESEQGWTSVYQSEALPETHLNSFMGYGIIEFSLPSALTTRKFRINIQQSNGRPSIYSIRLRP